jgi:hypothetical protein
MLFVDGHNTVSTHQFIHRVLDIPAGGVRRTTVLTINNMKYTLADKDKLRLRKEDENWHVLNPTQQWSWRLDRTAVTNVRSKYSEFYKYLKGFVNLRTENIKLHQWTQNEKDCVRIQVSELKNLFGSLTSVRSYAYMDKVGKQSLNWTMVKPEQYKASSNAFDCLIRPDQPEEDKHTNFYKAALLLVTKLETEAMDIRSDEPLTAPSKHIVPLLDEVLFQMNAHQVLIRKELPQGKVSSGIYEHWMMDWE